MNTPLSLSDVDKTRLHRDLVLQWEILKRFDRLTAAAQAKVGLILLYNIAAVCLLAGLNAVLPGQGSVGGIIATALALAALLCAGYALWLCLYALVPFLESSGVENTAFHSVFFFEHVAAHESPADYLQYVRSFEPDQRLMDAAKQVHANARGVRQKYKIITRAFKITLYVQIPVMGVWLVLRMM